MQSTKGMAFWANLHPQFHAVLRIVAAFMFLQAGMVKLFAIPIGMPPDGSTATFMTQIWIGGVLEFVGGSLILIGLFTRPVAFLLAGEMAVAYFQFHFPKGFWPAVNGGMPAVLYCFLWLYYSASGAGIWSVDSWLHHRRP
jgi:putative oxidoreductase